MLILFQEIFGSAALGFFVVVCVGFTIGVIGSMFGIGGGFIVTPFLHSVMGLSALQSVATSLGQMPLMSTSGCIEYYRKQKIEFKLGWLLLIGSIPASQLTVWGLSYINDQPWSQQPYNAYLSYMDFGLILTFCIMISAMALLNIYHFFKKKPDNQQQQKPVRKPVLLTVVMGIVLGFFSVLLGIGGGFFTFPYLTFYCGLQPAQAVATSLFALTITALLAVAQYLYNGHLMLPMALLLGGAGILGAQVGSRITLKLPGKVVIGAMAVLQLLSVVIYLSAKPIF